MASSRLKPSSCSAARFQDVTFALWSSVTIASPAAATVWAASAGSRLIPVLLRVGGWPARVEQGLLVSLRLPALVQKGANWRLHSRGGTPRGLVPGRGLASARRVDQGQVPGRAAVG